MNYLIDQTYQAIFVLLQIEVLVIKTIFITPLWPYNCNVIIFELLFDLAIDFYSIVGPRRIIINIIIYKL